MKTITKLITGSVVTILLSGCSTFDLTKERRDGNVVILVEAQHVKTGLRFYGDGATVASGDGPAFAGGNVAQATSMLGGSTGTSLAAGGVMMALKLMLDKSADDNEYSVLVSRPDDMLPTIGAPARMRRNSLGRVRFTPLMDGVKIGEWVKVVKTEQYWTLIPCKLPESGCQDKVLQQGATPAATAK